MVTSFAAFLDSGYTTCSVTVNEPVLVVTGDATNVTRNSVSLALLVNINLAGKYTTYDAGIVYGKSNSPTKGNDTVLNIPKDKDGKPDLSGSYPFQVDYLEMETTYYYRGFAVFDGKEYLGEIKSFKTKSLNISTEKMVDLGLPSGLKWAGWNVGATKPEEFGDYFCWGETAPKSNYNQTSYKYGGILIYGQDDVLYKYNTDPKYGNVDNLTQLKPMDDAAYVNWKENWRMPTDAEKTELLANTTHEKIEYKGVKGWIFTSKINGAAIFLPATGYKYQLNTNYVGEETVFWTSTLRSSAPSQAHIACNWIAGSSLLHEAGFEMDPTAESYHLSDYRCYGFPVRAVYGDPIPAEKYTLKTENPFELTPVSAKIKVSMTPAATATEFGLLYSFGLADPLLPSMSPKQAAAADGSVLLTGLGENTKYKACAYAIVDGETFYGNEIQFTTPQMALLSVLEPTDITYESATLNAKIDDLSAIKAHCPTLECGIAFGKFDIYNPDCKVDPTDSHFALTPDASGLVTKAVTGLKNYQDYYYRSYLKIGSEIYYSKDYKRFKTLDKPLLQWVDLGLSVLWASWDVGATAADQYGSYYAWAETTPKDPANPANWEASAYKWYDTSTSPLTIRKYYPGEATYYKGVPDGLSTVQPADDAATQEWGGGARMPSNAEFEELLANTTRTTEYYNGKELIKFTAANGNYIYFQYFSAWWSSSIYSEIVYANNLFTKGLNSVKMQYSRREYGSTSTSEPGCHIRPVKAK